MSNEKNEAEIQESVEEVEGYKAPPQKSLSEIMEADAHDESLKRYKETLLGKSGPIIVEPNNPNRVIVKQLALIIDDKPEMTLDLTENISELKKKVFKIKEGIQYKIRIDFIVQREIVTGLKYEQRIFKLGIPVEKVSHMVGSYGPKEVMQSFTTAQEEMPHGLMSRGQYTVKSLFTDDDKNEHLKWEWCFELSKDW